jgi:uncharacterized membrane protein
MKNMILFFAIIATGLMAGLFYAWSVSVMPGLKTLPDREFILGMQSMNKAIQNPLFFLAFFGAAICLPISCILNFKQPPSNDYYLLLAATILYLAGIMGTTIFGNVPLNNMLDSFNLQQAPPEAISNMRLAFEAKWNYLNTIRSFSAIISFCLLIIMIIKRYT